jgi:hypothetical protein
MSKPNFASELDSTASLPSPARDPASDARAAFAAQFIPAGARVLDLGCGGLALRRLLPHGCAYRGCDGVAFDPDTLICDLEAGEFPANAAADADVVVMLGLLDRIADAERLFAQLQRAGSTVLLSCNPADLAGSEVSRGANNRFGFYDLARLFDRHGFRIECTAPYQNGEMLMRLAPAERLLPLAAVKVAVISGGGDLGSRLGRRMINALLPGEAEVDHLTFDTLASARAHYDLVVVGVGCGLFQPLLEDAVLEVVNRGRAAIGLFGTHCRELIPRAKLDRLLDRFDTWFARTEDDLLMFGRGRDNAVYLGDWLIDQFPMSQGSIDELLLIGGDPDRERPAELIVETIQRHKQVYSTNPAALLCALTSAEMVAYAEPANSRLPGIASGEFRSLLIDIFGRSYPEKDFFLVDRDAVMRYKARVRGNVALLRERVAAVLRNVAVAAA